MKKTIKLWTLLAAMVAFMVSCTREPVSPTPPVPDEDFVSSDWVDLGLPSGLLWAKCNVGATSPQDFGDYFAWAETSPKSDYDWPTYQYWQDNRLTKYCSNSGWGHNGYTDNLTILEAADDAATANMSSGARTPTKDEWEELIANTTHVYTTIDTTYGILFTGSNGNTMFVPSAGFKYRFSVCTTAMSMVRIGQVPSEMILCSRHGSPHLPLTRSNCNILTVQSDIQ